jgi:hypothetical protein
MMLANMHYVSPVVEILLLAEDAILASSGTEGGTTTPPSDPNPDIGSDTDIDYPALPPDFFD